MDIIKSQIPELYPAPERGSSPDSGTGKNCFILPNPDRKLTKCWKDLRVGSIANLKWDVSKYGPYTVPSVGGQEVCLRAQCTGVCKNGCKNSASHVNYPPDIINAIHAHLDKCGIPKSE